MKNNYNTITIVRLKILCSKVLDCCCSSIMLHIFVIQISFESFERLELDSRVYEIKILFDLNSQGKKFEFFSQGTYKFQNEALFTLIMKM